MPVHILIAHQERFFGSQSVLTVNTFGLCVAGFKVGVGATEQAHDSHNLIRCSDLLCESTSGAPHRLAHSPSRR